MQNARSNPIGLWAARALCYMSHHAEVVVAPEAQQRSFGGDSRLVLESVGTADAAALRAIRQVVPAAIQEVARLVYQAPSELTSSLPPTAATEVAALLQGL